MKLYRRGIALTQRLLKMNQLKNLLLFVVAIAIIIWLHQPAISALDGEARTALKQAEQLYQQAQYPEAKSLLKTVIKQYQQPEDLTARAIATRNLALIHQRLGEWQQAEAAIVQAQKIVKQIECQSDREVLLAKVLEVKGQVELSLGRSPEALQTWRTATSLYESQGKLLAATQGKIYQANALQSLGLYSQSIKLLTATNKRLRAEPDSLIKAKALLNIANVQNRVGNYQSAKEALNSAYTMTQKFDSHEMAADILLSLGNNARLQANPTKAINFYQQAIAASHSFSPSELQLRGKLNLLEVLIDLGRSQTAAQLAAEIAELLPQLPLTQTTIQGKISLARHLMKLNAKSKQIANLLSDAVKQSQNLNIPRTETDALGVLGHLYENDQRWSEAAQITERALMIAQTINATELTYQWQWQLGRIFAAQDKISQAIAAYTQATKSLQSLRSDLLAISSDIRYSFRQQIEPVYRELAALLLQPEADQANLSQARQVIESLQVAELDNFFRDACLDAEPKQIDRLDPTAAIIYTIILQDRLEVIAAIPGKSLRHYSTKLPPSEIELIIASANSQLIEPRRLNLTLFQQVYDWLIRPLEVELAASNVKTLVLVPDGVLRNLPPATLHDGKQYLIEKYSVAIAPSLQLTEPSPEDVERQKILLAGLSESRQGFPRLPGVKQEIEQIEPLFAANVLLNNSFTELNFNRYANQTPFRVVHLATHGQFSSKAEETFVLTWDNRIDIEELSRLLRGDSNQLRPIELLVLSACETATGDPLATLGLAGIAVRAGARSTLASLWSVSDLATVKLMTNFYQQLAPGNMTKAEALRQAQIATLNDELFAHPYFWSAFILVGNWQ